MKTNNINNNPIKNKEPIPFANLTCLDPIKMVNKQLKKELRHASTIEPIENGNMSKLSGEENNYEDNSNE